jgi:hypothetical protein
LGTFVYQPGIKVYISTENNGTLDVSDDLVEGSMELRSDGVSSFSFTLQNTRRKYDGVFAPNDRIAVVMKRLTWLRTFTGYLNSVPLATAWPQAVPITASCALKRLQYWYWDSYVTYTQNLIQKALNARVQTGPNAGQSATDDGNITNVVLAILREVVGWPESKVHISQIPKSWFDIAFQIATSVDGLAATANQLAAQYYTKLGGGGQVAGSSTDSLGGAASGTSVRLPAGTYGGYSISGDQCTICEQIYQAGVMEGMTLRDIAVGIMTARQESSLHNTSSGDAAGPDSRGIFQQRSGWGSLAERMNPLTSARIFFRAMKGKYPNTAARQTVDPGAMSLKIQVYRSDLVSRYTRYWPMAVAAVAAMSKSQVSAPSASTQSIAQTTHIDPLTGKRVNGPATAASAAGTAPKGKTTADLLAVGQALWAAHPNIAYSQAAQDYKTNNPTALDCSLFIKWCYYHTTGKSDIPRTATAQYYWAIANGGKKISVAEAYKIPGACVFVLGEHVELTVGDNKTTTGSHGTGIRNGNATTSQSYWNAACILPNVIPSGAITGGSIDGLSNGAGVINPGYQVSTYDQSPQYDPNDRFDSLFGSLPWVATPSSSSDPDAILANSLSGVRALLNDQPLLPYLKTLLTSTMRSFCSAPNGDLIAWFPDYYGLWGTAAVMVLEPVELQNFTVTWSDDYLVTHQYATAGPDQAPPQVDLATGNVTGSSIPLAAATTMGIVTVEIPSVLYALLGVSTTAQAASNFSHWVLKRFGARPNLDQANHLQGLRAGFFYALYKFMQNWAYQYNANVPMTFMPELFPGMLIQIPDFDFQAYVTTVTHNFRFGDGGSFTTSANIAAPARLPKSKTDKNNVLIGLPMAGGYAPTVTGDSTADYVVDIAKVIQSTTEPSKTKG